MSSFTFSLVDILPAAASGPEIVAGAFGFPLAGVPVRQDSGFQHLLAQIVGTDTAPLPSPLYSTQALAPATPNLRATLKGAVPGQGKKAEVEAEVPAAELEHQLHLKIQPQSASIEDLALPLDFPAAEEPLEEDASVQQQDANVDSWFPAALQPPPVVPRNATWGMSSIENWAGSEEWHSNEQSAIPATILTEEPVAISETVTGVELTERTEEGSESVFPPPPKWDGNTTVPTLSAGFHNPNPQPQDEGIVKDCDLANRPAPAATMTDRPVARIHEEVHASRPGPDVPTPFGEVVRLLLKQNVQTHIPEIDGGPKKASEIPLGTNGSPFRETAAPDRSTAKASMMESAVSRMPLVEAPQRNPSASVSGTRNAVASEQKPSLQHNSEKEVTGAKAVVAATRSSERLAEDALREDEPPPQRGTGGDTAVRPALIKSNVVHEAPPPTAGPPEAPTVVDADAVARLEEPIQIRPAVQPLRHLRVSLGEPGSGNVEVLVNQRPGGVEVSIHSADQKVRDTLRSGLTTLIESFDRRGVAVEHLPSGSTVRQEPSSPLVEWMQGRADAHEKVMELAEQQATDGGQQQFHRQPQWELAEENRRRRGQDVGVWKKYLEEYSWLNQ